MESREELKSLRVCEEWEFPYLFPKKDILIQ